MKKAFALIAIIIMTMLLAAGCGSSVSLPVRLESPGNSTGGGQTSPSAKTALDLLVSRDFGQQIILEQRVEYKEDASILDILQTHLRVETGYGGSFVNAINGLGSSSGGSEPIRQDWFFYINGIACDVGVLDYDPQNAGSIWWDYHPWQMGAANSAVIGSYPEPFRHGYRGKIKPTLLMSCPAEENWSRAMLETLQSLGVSAVKMLDLEEAKLENREGPTIVLGKWDDLKKLKYLEDFNQAYNRNGAGIHFTAAGLELVDYSGEAVKEMKGSVGVIIASGAGLGDDSPLWLISGTDEKAWHNALNILINNPAKIKHLYGAAVNGEEVIALPFH